MIAVPNDNLIWLYGKALIHVESDPVYRNERLDVRDLSAYMEKLLDRKGGTGLAAPQVGIFKRIVVVRDKVQMPRVYVNPEIVGMYGKELPVGETCLSFPPHDNGCLVPRMQTILVEYDDLDKPDNRATVELHGAEACVMQHELDHLDGTFFFDRVQSSVKRNMVEKFEEWKKENIAHVQNSSRSRAFAGR